MNTKFKLVSVICLTLAASLFSSIGMANASAYDAGAVTIQTSSDAAGIPSTSAAMLREMLNSHNAQRAAGGLAPLTVDSRLEAVALDRALDMATRNYFDHVSPEGIMAFDLLDASGYVSYTAGENIALNSYADALCASKAMASFMASPTHRANIMNRNFSQVGMAVAVGSNGLKYFAVVYAG